MREIKEVVRDIKCELKHAYKFAEEANKHKMEYPTLADAYYKIANDNLSHMDILHKEIVALIDKVKKSGREIPRGMMDVWEFEHEEMIEEAAEIKAMLMMYKGG